MAKAKTEEKIEITPIPVPEEKPSMLTFSEFAGSIRKRHVIETLGGFSYWMQRQGMPPKWPKDMWEAKLEEYLTRKL